MMRCRPGTVTHTAFATVPDQRCTASLSLALHRIRDTSHLILATMGQARVTPENGDDARRLRLSLALVLAG
jgi:hypothetical protein